MSDTTNAAKNVEALRVRFNLRTSFVVLTVFALVFTLIFSTPLYVSVPFLFALSAMVPAFLTAGMIYGSGNTRAFCIGGMFPAGFLMVYTFFVLLGSFRESLDRLVTDRFAADRLIVLSVISWLLILFVGAGTVVIRQLAKR